MCTFFARGNSNRGSNCKFAHDERYKSQAKSRFDARRSSPGKMKRKGGGKGKGKKGRATGAVEGGEADEEDNEEECEFMEVDMDLPADTETKG